MSESHTARERIGLGRRRVVWAGGRLWFRTYTPGGYDGYRTITGHRLPCGEVEMLWAGLRPEWKP